MKKYLLLLFFILILLSCHKDRQNICNGSFVTLSPLYMGTASPSYWGLFSININTGIPEDSNPPKYATGHAIGYNAYDYKRNYYYIYSNNAPYISTPPIYLYQFNLSNGATSTFPSGVCDTLMNWPQDLLLCNTTTDKLYLIDHGGAAIDRIYEISTTGTFSEKEIFAVDTQTAIIHAPVIDETTGYIYFFYAPNLIAVNPTSGISTIVKTYTNVVPYLMQYAPTDGMFYGVNIFAMPYTFISIDPKTGNVTTLAQMSYFILGGMGQTFDYCSNLYILYGGGSTYWLDPSTGQVVKQANVPIGGTYVNAVL